ncbi:hypothetical protein LCGC14_1228110 [marine sediment metagenome]|uniref:Uncharacterized protein n=1 Tax=marine sediment metagenome TaxID=412755 RepID=A0A0F9PDN8_9ZZZZ
MASFIYLFTTTRGTFLIPVDNSVASTTTPVSETRSTNPRVDNHVNTLCYRRIGDGYLNPLLHAAIDFQVLYGVSRLAVVCICGVFYQFRLALDHRRFPPRVEEDQRHHVTLSREAHGLYW